MPCTISVESPETAAARCSDTQVFAVPGTPSSSSARSVARVATATSMRRRGADVLRRDHGAVRGGAAEQVRGHRPRGQPPARRPRPVVGRRQRVQLGRVLLLRVRSQYRVPGLSQHRRHAPAPSASGSGIAARQSRRGRRQHRREDAGTGPGRDQRRVHPPDQLAQRRRGDRAAARRPVGRPPARAELVRAVIHSWSRWVIAARDQPANSTGVPGARGRARISAGRSPNCPSRSAAGSWPSPRAGAGSG